MRNLSLGVWLCVAAGCMDPASMLQEQPQTPPAEVPQPFDAPADTSSGDATATAPVAETPAPTEAPAEQPAPPKSIIGQTTEEVVHLQEFHAQHPELVIVENKFTGSDPLTAALEGYVHLSAKASTLGMKQALQNHKVLHERPPTYPEFLQMMREHRFSFAQLPPNRIYAYDSQAGTIVVLEEKTE